MKNLKSRWFLILVFTALAIWAVSDPSKFILGPDLSGGTILIYSVNQKEKGESIPMDKLIGSLKERLDPAGLFNYVIRPLGGDRVEIIMPQAESQDVDRVKRMVSTVGQLQFRIVANRKRHGDLIERAELAWPKKTIGKEGVFVPYGVYKPIDKTAPDYAGLTAEADKAWPNKVLSEDVKFVPISDFTSETDVEKGHFVKKGADGLEYVLCKWSDDDIKVDDDRNLTKVDDAGNHYVLVYQDDMNVTGEYLTRVYPTMHDGNVAVGFQFNPTGATKFYQLTGEFQPEPDGSVSQLAVVLDNQIRSAPNLQARISGNGVISGNFTKEEINDLVRILDAGQLPYALEKEPSSQFQLGPTLGLDTIKNAKVALSLSLALVVIFMLIYYRVLGVVAICALTLNILFTVALMVIFKATWTLPGLAGLVLTVGMAVDANVLIYERIREEIERKASLGLAVRNGFEKAFSTILDSNVTTILTAIILFVIGTDQIKGFAITLILGIITSMFCALFVSRTLIETYYQWKRPRTLSMMKMLTATNIDFLKYRKLALAGSLAVILAGIVVFSLRGASNFDVDFTGGTMVGLKLTKPLDSAEVRKMASSVLPDVAIESLSVSDEPQGVRYIVRTTERDNVGEGQEKPIRQRLAEEFKDYLQLPQMSFGEITKIPPRTDDNKDKVPPQLAAFAGGSEATIEFKEPYSPEFVQSFFSDEFRKTAGSTDPSNLFALVPVGATQSAVDGSTSEVAYTSFIIGTNGDLAKILPAVQGEINSTPDFDQFSQFGPQVAGETQTRAIWAICLSWAGIIMYVWFRFGSVAYGLSGVVALVHDVLVAVGLLSIMSAVAAISFLFGSEMKIDLTTVAAILTLIGYSINDTIVIFDRVREVKGKAPQLSEAIINRSINETLSRTVITALTTFVSVFVLYIGGGASLRSFSFILLIGVVVGTYSTLFIACPSLFWLSGVGKSDKLRELQKSGSTAAVL